MASNNKFEVSSKLFTSPQAFDQHPPSCPRTRAPHRRRRPRQQPQQQQQQQQQYQRQLRASSPAPLGSPSRRRPACLACACACAQPQREGHLLVWAHSGGSLAGSCSCCRPWCCLSQAPDSPPPPPPPPGLLELGSVGLPLSQPRSFPAACKSAWLRVTCQCLRQRLREKNALHSFFHRHTVFYPKSHFYSNILLPLGEYLLSGILVLFFFFGPPFFFFFFFFFSHFFDYCLYLGKLEEHGFEPFPESKFF